MRRQQIRNRIETGLLKKIILCSAIFMLGFIENGFCQQKPADFEARPFLMVINRPEGSSAYKYLNMIYSEIFRRLEIPLEMKYIPLKRGANIWDSGIFDGETTRIRSYEDAHPTLIRIKEFLYRTNVSAYASSPSIESMDSWESLKGTKYKIEYPRGAIISENNLIKVVDPKNLSHILTAEQGIKRLFINRTDIYIDDDLVVIPLLRNFEKSYDRKVRNIGLMEGVPLYMFIHQKNHLLEPILTKIIKEVRTEGLIEAYRKIVFGF